MVNLPPFRDKYRFPNFKLKFKLGVLLLCLSLLSDYQPTVAFPPVKRNLVFAEITQEQSVTPSTSQLTFQLPHPGYITTPFSSYHPGIDLCSGLGTPIKPIAAGTVISTGYNFFGLGLVVEVEHQNGYVSLYAHMGKIYVQKGQAVDVNDFLGEIGMTGNTTGPHTHLEVSKDGKKIDPRLVLPEIRKYPSEADFAVTNSSTPSAVIAPVSTPVATVSAQTIKPYQTDSVNPIASEAKNILPKTIEEKPAAEKIDLPAKNIQNIIDIASPKPSIAPIPKGGAFSLRNFTWFGFKKS